MTLPGNIMHMRAMPILMMLAMVACTLNASGLKLAPGWKARSIIVWREAHPDMMVLSADRRWLYVSCETEAHPRTPSLAVYDMSGGHNHVLLTGLHRADGLKLAPDGSLWLGEEFEKGLIWRIAQPDRLPYEQFVDRRAMESSHPSIAPLPAAGAFAHEGMAFSSDGRFAYLADEFEQGAVYRFALAKKQLDVLTDKGWVRIEFPDNARLNARHLGARAFNRIEDMETLPDGRVLMSETGTGRILVLDDRGPSPVVETYLEQAGLAHPDNLAWDEQRRWLWITDDSHPSLLWLWDGRHLSEIARHDQAEITGVIVDGDNLYINLQNHNGPELTLQLTPPPPIP